MTTEAPAQRDADRTIEELLAMIEGATPAPEPMAALGKGVINDGSDPGLPVPIVMDNLKSAGYSIVWDRKTGEPSLVNNNMLLAQIRKRHEDGTLAFVTVKPPIEPIRGTYKCLLHPDQPDRARYTQLGLPVCPKSNLTSPFQVTQHMKKRHKTAWDTLEEERTRQEKVEEREFQKALLLAARGVNPDTFQPAGVATMATVAAATTTMATVAPAPEIPERRGPGRPRKEE